MTPEKQAHLERVQQLKSEWDDAEEHLKALREDFGLVAKTLLPGKPIDMPKRGLTEEGMTELKEAERKRDEAEDRWREAVGMPLKQRHTT